MNAYHHNGRQIYDGKCRHKENQPVDFVRTHCARANRTQARLKHTRRKAARERWFKTIQRELAAELKLLRQWILPVFATTIVPIADSKNLPRQGIQNRCVRRMRIRPVFFVTSFVWATAAWVVFVWIGPTGAILK